MKNDNGGLKLPLFDLWRSDAMFRCQNLLGSQLGTFNLNYWPPATHIRTDKATKIHTLTPLTYELFFFQNSSITHLNARVYNLRCARHLQCRAPPLAMTERYTFLSCKPEKSMDSSTSMRNNTYLLTLQANCNKQKHNADATTAD